MTDCKECLEQARLLGMSGSREAALRAENAELKAVAGRLFPMVEEAWWDRYSAGMLPGAGYTGRAIQMLSREWDWRDKAGFQTFEKRVAALLGKSGNDSLD